MGAHGPLEAFHNNSSLDTLPAHWNPAFPRHQHVVLLSWFLWWAPSSGHPSPILSCLMCSSFPWCYRCKWTHRRGELDHLSVALLPHWVNAITTMLGGLHPLHWCLRRRPHPALSAGGPPPSVPPWALNTRWPFGSSRPLSWAAIVGQQWPFDLVLNAGRRSTGDGVVAVFVQCVKSRFPISVLV
jgi:hypothetical protein